MFRAVSIKMQVFVSFMLSLGVLLRGGLYIENTEIRN